MECGLIGLQGVGKTTLFTALTAHAVEVQPGAMKPSVGVASIPDPRLDRIADFIDTKEVIHATLQVVDIPGVPTGGSALANVLAHVRQVDALCHVVRCFDFGMGRPTPGSDIAAMNAELLIADLVVVEAAIDKARRAVRGGDNETKQRLAVLERCEPMLDDERPLREETWGKDEEIILRTFGLMTAKPMLYVANVGEDDLAGEGPAAEAVADAGPCVVLCATLESEIAELVEADRGEMLADLGIAEPALGALTRAANDLLGLATFYTAGETAVRAWSIPADALAPRAAGAIHGDLERGFIRAECYHVDDLFELGSEKAIKEAGKLRSEGKAYAMQDGDVAHILFTV